MLTDNEVNVILSSLKQIIADNPVHFPQPGYELKLDMQSMENNSDKFILDINRKGRLKITKCTYQTRYKNTLPLIRIDIDGPPHPNPDGTIVPCPHIHIYREGYDLKWAYPLNQKIITDSNDLLQVLIDFLEYNNITNINDYNFLHQERGLI